MCKSENENIVFDTYLDSHFDLGINAPVKDRVALRRVTSCAPLVTEGYKKSVQDIYGGSNDTRYLYGPLDTSLSATTNLTWDYPELSENEFWVPSTSTSDRAEFTLR